MKKRIAIIALLLLAVLGSITLSTPVKVSANDCSEYTDGRKPTWCDE